MLKIFTAGILWGTVGIFVNTLNYFGADVNYIGVLRMSSAFIIMLCAGIFRYGHIQKIIIRDKKILLTCITLGILCNGIFNICYARSIKLNGMAIAAVF